MRDNLGRWITGGRLGTGDSSLKKSHECLFCNKVFSSYISSKRKYCSASCSSKGTYNHPYRFVPKGEAHYLWSGGISPKRKKIAQTREYREWRTAVYERDNYTCVLCGIRGNKLNADHIERWVDSPGLRLSVDNGRTLCVPCHRKTPTYGITGVRLNEKRLDNCAKKLGDYPVDKP